MKNANEKYNIACGICPSTENKNKFSVLLLDVNLADGSYSIRDHEGSSSEFESESLVKPIKYISSASSGLTSSIFCFYSEDGKLFCVNYDLDDNTKEELKEMGGTCAQKLLKIDYIEKGKDDKQTTVSCLGENGLIYAAAFVGEEIKEKNFTKLENCEILNGYTFLYDEDFNFNVVSDAQCDGEQYPFVDLNRKMLHYSLYIISVTLAIIFMIVFCILN